ncbi:dTDP-4-dehydrorhamnose reductase [Brevibacillus choshinensis]|uniref:dTDP-4-dehydrorhamnose reductase n=1 Tax=Brevibacillus choshinensis TaxID=54911 RepID=A0ABR5N562_BRECH|nr:sugar nucleotide-binding protein [Brevibacillus choshinensis]KQL45761.1 dTDP-4-dehydrorhamnose reductase [Brevibacillus choshinensis]
MTKRKVLLLGGSGYLGAQIFRHLKQDQENEIVATCFSSPMRSALKRVDVKDASLFAGLLDEFLPDVVIWSLLGKDNIDAQELISKGMQTLLEFVSENSKIIYLSTDGVFGQKTGPFQEEEETELLDERNPLAGYCLAKIRGEELVRERNENHLILRFGPIYGKNDEGMWDKRVRALAVELEQGREVVRTGNLYKTFIHVDDLARAITELMPSSYTGTLHLGPAEKESYYTFCRKMARGLELNPDLVKEDELTVEKASELGIPLDTSLHTNKARAILQTTFRNV